MDEEKIYRWVTHGPRNCERCEELDGKEMRFSDWFSSVLPGMHAGCDCSLEPVDEIQSEKRVVITQLKSIQRKHSAVRVGVDKRITHSHGALKPLVRKLKANLPMAKSRPLDIAHFGG